MVIRFPSCCSKPLSFPSVEHKRHSAMLLLGSTQKVILPIVLCFTNSGQRDWKILSVNQWTKTSQHPKPLLRWGSSCRWDKTFPSTTELSRFEPCSRASRRVNATQRRKSRCSGRHRPSKISSTNLGKRGEKTWGIVGKHEPKGRFLQICCKFGRVDVIVWFDFTKLNMCDPGSQNRS